jgi:hypothetical protein
MSITLTTPYVVNVNGSVVEDDTIGACTSSSMDYLARMLTYTFKIGTLTGSPSNLNVGPYSQNPPSQNIVVSVYVGPTTGTQTFGQWLLNGVLQATIIPSGTLAPFVTSLLADRNSAEGFVAVSGGLLPGSVVPWTQL